MKKSLSLFVSLIFAVMCMLISFNAFAQGENIIDANNTVVTVSDKDIVYDQTMKTPNVIVVYNGVVLVKDVDYNLSYLNNIDAGTATAVISGINSYSGSITKDFTITPAKLNDKNKVNVVFDKTSLVYNENPLIPVMYVSYDKGDGLGPQYLIQDVDYTVSYINNNAPGKAQAKITGIGNYNGSITKKFNIVPAKVSDVKISKKNTSITVKWNSVSGATGYQLVSLNSDNKTSNIAYIPANKTSYKINKLKNGKTYNYQVRAYVVISDKKKYGEFSDVVTTAIKPKQTKLTSVTLDNNKLCIEWQKVDCDGYQILYTTDKKFKNNIKKITVNNGNSTSKKIKKIDKDKKYYVKIKSFVTVDGNKYFSDNSTVLSTYYSNVYSTYYSYYVNNASRTTNLKIASKEINGTIIQPGEEFNFNKVVGTRTAAKGYKNAHVFSDDGVTMGLAGGICQVASTMFNTVLKANVEIVERHQHSQRVSYVPLGRDAAISGNVQNFRWKNNTKYAIKIKMTVKNGVITCTFYTCEKASPKKVSLDVTQSGKKFTLKRSVKGKVNYQCSSTY